MSFLQRLSPIKLFGFIKAIYSIYTDKEYVDFNIYYKRVGVCMGCTSRVSGKCKECGCIISLKAVTLSQYCDRNKWEY